MLSFDRCRNSVCVKQMGMIMSKIANGLNFICLMVVLSISLLTGCGGGGGSSDSNSNSNTIFGPVVGLQLNSDIPIRIQPGSELSIIVYAIDEAGNTQDVTNQVTSEVTPTSGLYILNDAKELKLQFSKKPGPVAFRLRALGLTIEKSTFISSVPSSQAIQNIALAIGEGYAPLTPNDDKSYSLLPNRALMITSRALLADDFIPVNNEVQITSSDPAVLSVSPGAGAYGDVPWWTGHTLTPGIVTITAKWAGYEVQQVINVSPGLIISARKAKQIGITENATGRSTVYMLLQYENSSQSQVLAYSESQSNNQWTKPVLLTKSDYSSSAGIFATESSNGYRVLVTDSLAGGQSIYRIDPNGKIIGPVVIQNDGSGILRVVVNTDGNVHIWCQLGNRVIRKFVRFSNSSVIIVNSVTITSEPYNHHAQVVISNDGTVVVNWTDSDCRIHYAFDNMQSFTSISSDSIGSVQIEECDAKFTSPFTQFKSAAANGELGFIIQYWSNTYSINTQVALVRRDGVATSKLVDRNAGGIAELPGIDMTSTGELLAAWATEERGVWAIHRAAGSDLSNVFLICEPFFSLGTPFVNGVYSRGDGRFVVVSSGRSGGTPLEMRNYSQSDGVGPRQFFRYQNSVATSITSLIATPRGISAVWSFSPDFDTEELDAIQRFLP